ncbi:hypothetical protein ACFCYH_16460 [Streptomyces sp. NPDC056400]|uniref:hypothetical protein n=1 Tax=Streptomyces sp. NPDC056400 TaxID=3345808 RepID=UPI0035DA3EF5
MTRKPRPATVCASRIRSRSVLAALLFLPALLLVKVLVLTTDRGGRCFVNDTGCAPFPVGAFGALLAALLAARRGAEGGGRTARRDLRLTFP